MTYDMFDFMANDTASQGLTGTHFMKTLRMGNDIAEMKHPSGGPFERYEMRNNNIYLRYESGGILNANCEWINNWNPEGFRFWPENTYVWCPRYVTDGMIYQSGVSTEYYVWSDANGEHRKTIAQPSWPCCVNVLHDVPLGGNVGLRPTLVALSHFWKTGTIDPGNREVYYYDQWLGMMIWEDWNGGIVTARNIFNVEILTDAVPVGPAIPPLTGFTVCGA